ncbi:MAG TPA: NADH-quinone oxidoreductase subunit M [Anaerolineaceae bacterium]
MVNPLILVTFLPLAGVPVLLFLNSQQKTAIRWTALATSLLTFGLSFWVLALFDRTNPNLQLLIQTPWLRLPNLEITFALGVDGLSLLMVLLTVFLTPIAILSTWSAVQEQVKGFMLFFLLLEVGMNGVFLAQDMVLFYVFWEFTLIPMIFLIGIWGSGRRIYAAIKFFLFTMAGSVLMLLGILYIAWQAHTTYLPWLAANRALFASAQIWLFMVFGIAFAIKVPLFPLHSWLPDAYVDAPTAGSVILAGVMAKMGAYGFLRFNLPLFPQATMILSPWLALLAVVSILYGAIIAFSQKDLKKLVAYSSISHLGFVILGIFALTNQGLSGAVLQMVNHGLSTGGLFLITGMLYERRNRRELAAFGGLWKVMPLLGSLTLIIVLSSAGLPGLNGFVGEFTILLGAFGSQLFAGSWMAGIGALGVILAAVYLLYMFEKAFLGPITQSENRILPDLGTREILTLLPVLILIFWIGLYPKPFFELINPTLEQLAKVVLAAAVGR